MKCNHIDCGSNEKIWLPHIVREDIHGLKSHPYCVKCGMVKNIGSDRAKKVGYFINVISKLEKYLKISCTSVRMRLVVKDLEKIDSFEDEYSRSKYSQEKTIIILIRKYYQIPERIIQQFL